MCGDVIMYPILIGYLIFNCAICCRNLYFILNSTVGLYNCSDQRHTVGLGKDFNLYFICVPVIYTRSIELRTILFFVGNLCYFHFFLSKLCYICTKPENCNYQVLIVTFVQSNSAKNVPSTHSLRRFILHCRSAAFS